MFHNHSCKAALLGVAGLISLSAAAAESPAQPTASVLVEPAVEIAESSTRTIPGRLEAIEEVSMVPRISGNINTIKFSEGDMVKKGQLLYELEDTTYRAQMLAAKAKVEQCKAELNYAKINYDRQKTLEQQQAVSKSTYDDAERLYKLNKAKLAEAEASLLDAENNLSYTRIFAPISGRIGKVTLTAGNYVTPSTGELVDIVQIDPIYANFAISERDYQALFGSLDAMKKKAKIRLKMADDTVYPQEGHVALVDNKADTDTSTMQIWARVPNPEGKLVPGGLVTVMISKVADKKYPAVKLSALMTDAKGNYVYVVGPDNKVQRRDVRLGSMIGNLQTILEGIKPGEIVIVDGTHKAAPGAQVNPVRAK